LNEIRSFGSPLKYAINEGRVEVVAVMLRAGADPHMRFPETYPGANERVWKSDCAGKNALDAVNHWMTWTKEPAKVKEKIKQLIEDDIAGKLREREREAPRAAVKQPPTAGAADVPALWKRIKKALAKRDPDLKKSLRPGAKPPKLQKLEETCGVSLP